MGRRLLLQQVHLQSMGSQVPLLRLPLQSKDRQVPLQQLRLRPLLPFQPGSRAHLQLVQELRLQAEGVEYASGASTTAEGDGAASC